MYTCGPGHKKKAASLDGFIGKEKAELAQTTLSPWKERLRNSTKKGKKKSQGQRYK